MEENVLTNQRYLLPSLPHLLQFLRQVVAFRAHIRDGPTPTEGRELRVRRHWQRRLGCRHAPRGKAGFINIGQACGVRVACGGATRRAWQQRSVLIGVTRRASPKCRQSASFLVSGLSPPFSFCDVPPGCQAIASLAAPPTLAHPSTHTHMITTHRAGQCSAPQPSPAYGTSFTGCLVLGRSSTSSATSFAICGGRGHRQAGQHDSAHSRRGR